MQNNIPKKAQHKTKHFFCARKNNIATVLHYLSIDRLINI